jgi:hypothetical protein
MDADNLLRQAKITGEDYLDAARRHIIDSESFPHTFENCMRLAELMAKDFDTMTKSTDAQTSCTILDRISGSLESIATSMENPNATEIY